MKSCPRYYPCSAKTICNGPNPWSAATVINTCSFYMRNSLLLRPPRDLCPSRQRDRTPLAHHLPNRLLSFRCSRVPKRSRSSACHVEFRARSLLDRHLAFPMLYPLSKSVVSC